MINWQPIETLPRNRNGKRLIVWERGDDTFLTEVYWEIPGYLRPDGEGGEIPRVGNETPCYLISEPHEWEEWVEISKGSYWAEIAPPV